MTFHEMSFDYSHDYVRALCSCGWSGVWQATGDQAVEEWDFHCDDVFEEATRP